MASLAATCFPAPAKMCESCNAAAALLFCRKDAVFLCIACDGKIHDQTRHERVWMCEVCEQGPASVTCKADAAALCVTCDRDIHSANPISRRHDRIPVTPFFDCAEIPAKTSGHLKSCVTQDDMKSIEMLLDFDSRFRYSVNDGVFPFQTQIDFTDFYNKNSQLQQSLSHNDNSVSSSSIDEREAKVKRYIEKRKKRKFQKTIRYASRKAYAETRPRIKGRFVKQTDSNVDGWFFTSNDG